MRWWNGRKTHGDDFPREICCGAGVPYRLFLAALNKADNAATLPKDCSSRLPLSNGRSAAWAGLIHQRCSRSYLGSSARLPWLSALGACGLFQSVCCNVDRLLLLILLFYFFHSLDFGVFTRFLDVTFVVDRVFFIWPRLIDGVECKESVQRAANGCVDFNLVQS